MCPNTFTSLSLSPQKAIEEKAICFVSKGRAVLSLGTVRWDSKVFSFRTLWIIVINCMFRALFEVTCSLCVVKLGREVRVSHVLRWSVNFDVFEKLLSLSLINAWIFRDLSEKNDDFMCFSEFVWCKLKWSLWVIACGLIYLSRSLFSSRMHWKLG